VNHQLESRMRENRLSGSEGGGVEANRLSLPLYKMDEFLRDRFSDSEFAWTRVCGTAQTVLACRDMVIAFSKYGPR
jgi:hypothetical protein